MQRCRRPVDNLARARSSRDGSFSARVEAQTMKGASTGRKPPLLSVLPWYEACKVNADSERSLQTCALDGSWYSPRYLHIRTRQERRLTASCGRETTCSDSDRSGIQTYPAGNMIFVTKTLPGSWSTTLRASGSGRLLEHRNSTPKSSLSHRFTRHLLVAIKSERLRPMNRLTGVVRLVVLIGPALLAPLAHGAEQVYYVTGSAKMICQLTGLPKPSGTPAGGVFGTDLGFSFEHNGQLYFLFGDTRGGQLNAVDPNVDDSPMKNLDSIATSTASTPNDLCSNLHFVTDSTGTGTYLPPQIATVGADGLRDEAYQSAGHIGHSTFKVPNSGFSWNNTIYVFFTKFETASKNGNPGAGAGYRRTAMASSADVSQVIGGSKGNFKYEFEVSLDTGDGGLEQSGRPLGKFLNL